MIAITIKPNEAPVLNADVSGPHASTELADTTGDTALADAQTLNGTLIFTDVNFFDTHTVSPSVHSITWSGGSTLPSGLAAVLAGALTTTISPSSDNSTGTVTILGPGLIQSLRARARSTSRSAPPTTISISSPTARRSPSIYDVTVTDDDGAISTQPVTFVITGTNDAAGDHLDAITQLSGPMTEQTAPPLPLTTLITGGTVNVHGRRPDGYRAHGHGDRASRLDLSDGDHGALRSTRRG